MRMCFTDFQLQRASLRKGPCCVLWNLSMLLHWDHTSHELLPVSEWHGRDIRQMSFWETSNDQLWFEDSLIPWWSFFTLHDGKPHFHLIFPPSSFTTNQNIMMTWCLSQTSWLPLYFSLTGISPNKNCTLNSILESSLWRTWTNTFSF